MGNPLANPRTRRDSEWQVIARHHSARRGVMSDGQRTNVPLDGVWESINVLLHGDGRKESRSGTRVLGLNAAALPKLRTGIDATKSVNVVTSSGAFSSTDVGTYFYWPTEGKYDLITALLSSSTVRVDNSDTRVRSATATWDPENEVWIYSGTGATRGEINAAIWDRVNKKHVILLGTQVYYADWECSSWIPVYLIGDTAPANTKSEMHQRGDSIYLWNANGLYAINMGLTTPLAVKVNNAVDPISVTITGDAQDQIYCRRYIVTAAKMTGNYFQNIREGNTVELESAPAQIDSSGRDYSAIFTERPIGDGTYVSSSLVGGSLQSPMDTVAGWEPVSDGQFGCTFDGDTNNITVNFNGCATWDDVTGRIQTSLQYFWSTMLCYKDGDHIVLEVPNTAGVFGECSAGSGGTDISGAAYLSLAATATVTSVLGDPPLNVVLSGNSDKEYTHLRVYGTLDVGENGINPTAGAGNNSESYGHVEDVPKCSAFIVSSTGDGVITASKGTFKPYHTGCVLGVEGVGDIVGITYVNSTTVTFEDTWVFTNASAAIGGTAFTFSRSGNLLSGTQFTEFDNIETGDLIFTSDGEILHVVGKPGGAPYTAESGTLTDVAGVIMPTSFPNGIVFTDTTSDDVIASRLSIYWLKNRFWQPIPNCDVGVEIDGFTISAVRGGKSIYETQLADPQFAGYYDPEFQIDTIQDAIQALREYNGVLAAICSQSTTTWSSELTGTDSRPGIGSTVSFLAQRKVADYRIGTNSPGSIVSITDGIDILFTNNSEVRLFDGKAFGANLAEGKTMKLLRRLQMVSAASYDPIGGYFIWGTNSALTTIGSASSIPFPDICHRFSIQEDQGVIGGVQIDGDDWLTPPHGISGYEVSDDDGHFLQAVFDNRDGKFYWISTYDGPTGSGLAKVFSDKHTGSADGTEIDWSLTFGADIGSLMKYDIRHEVSNLTIDPYDASKGGEGSSGYDDEGFRDGLEIDLYAYRRSDGWETPYSQALNIVKDGDISFDRTPVDKAIQIKISGNRSECVISELVNYYTVAEQAAPPSKREMTEGDYQSALCAPVLWLSRGSQLYKNLATGQLISGTAVPVTGVDGKVNSAFQISAAFPTISVVLTAGSILLWTDGTVTVSIGGNSVVLTSAGTYGGWTLYYATGITRSGILTLTPTGTRKIEDVRAYNSDIDSDIRTYIYNDMVKNNGNNTLKLW